ncbi:hypothetical protein Rin_00017420, partial [Candidatus Regiella insecticola 5.15]
MKSLKTGIDRANLMVCYRCAV